MLNFTCRPILAIACTWTLSIAAASESTLGTSVQEAPPPSSPTPTSPPVEPDAPPSEPVPSAVQPPESEAPATMDLPDAKSIIEAAALTIGTVEAVAAVKSFSLKASMTSPMGELIFEVQSLRNGAFVLKQSKSGIAAGTVVFDGTEAWVVLKEGEYELVDTALVAQGRQQFEMMFPIWLSLVPREHTTTLEALEQAVFAEHECYKVRFGTDHEQGITRFGQYDVNDKSMRGMSMVIDGPMAQPVEFIYSDWKPVGDLKVFHAVTIKRFGHTMNVAYTDVAFNSVEGAIFDRPEPVKELINKRDAAPAAPSSPMTESTPPPASEPASPPPDNREPSW